MSIEDYNKTISMYQELLTACMGIPDQHKKVMDAHMDFVSKAFINPAYTMKASWFIHEGQCICVDRVLQMHPFDFCVTYANLTKDWDKALDMLQKYLHEKIDSWT